MKCAEDRQPACPLPLRWRVRIHFIFQAGGGYDDARMNDRPPPPLAPPPTPPPVAKPAIAGKWILWIVAAAVLPGLAFVFADKKVGLDALAPVFIFGGLIGQLVMSILLGITLSQRLGKGGGIAVLLVIALLVGSVAVGCCSAAAGCAVAGTSMNFH